MTKAISIMLFVSIGLVVGFSSLFCASRIAICIGGRLGEAIRGGSPEMLAVAAFWLVGLLVSSMLNIVFGWLAASGLNSHAPDHAFYAMAFLVMFTLPFLSTCLGMTFLAAIY